MDNYQLSPDLDMDKVFLVKRSELEGRLDPYFYKPRFVKIDKAIKAKTVTKLGGLIIGMYGGATPKKSEAKKYYSDKENGIPLLRVQNITEEGINLDDAVYINHETHTGYLSRSQVFQNDLLVTITGRIASSAVAPPGFTANINQHSVVIKTNSHKTSKYIATFLNSNVGQLLALKRTTGGTRPALDYGALKSIPIPEKLPISGIMETAYAAKKQKEAESLRLLDSIDDYLLDELGIKLPEQEKIEINNRIFFRSANTVSGYRLDPNTYKKERLDAIKSIEQGIYVSKPLHQVVRYKRKKISDFARGSNYIGLENIESNTGEWIPTESKESISSAAIFGKDDILFPKLRPYLNKVFYSDTEGLCSTEFHVFRSYSENNSYIANFLRSKVVVAQTRNLMSGNTLPRLQFEDIQKLLIPIPTLKKQTEIANHITEVRNQTKQLREEAKKEVEQAKKEVEMMILGEDKSIA